ncbi:hypothetical protein [Rhodopirellula sp. MGV]|uniref:hypothetical protein n=1 Tax=Rhodopirellula sp. MGV TaxID=2023130 RepID=UPI001E51048B|nr:hypothetical protein [Rhodopirellula sp. MGV]
MRGFSLAELMSYAFAWAYVLSLVGLEWEDTHVWLAVPGVLALVLPGPLIEQEQDSRPFDAWCSG